MSISEKMIPVQRPCIGQRELDAVSGVFNSRWLGMGSVTRAFEKELCEFLGVKHVITVSTGTAALHLALAVLELKPGDEVVVPSLTFVSCLQAILAVRARPVFCDVDENTLNVDIDDAKRKITKRTKVIMPVHFAGVVCDMEKLLTIARDEKIKIVEDAAHAFGSTYKGRMAGTIGDINCFSFDPIKNITCGEGGAIATNNHELASRVLPKRNVGINKDTWTRLEKKQPWYYEVVTQGYRYHLSNINAAIGIEQLKQFSEFKARKQAVVRSYDESFKEVDGLKLIRHPIEETFPFFYVIRVLNNRRDALMNYLKERGIASLVHYIPNHLHPLCAEFRVPLATTERLYDEILTLPLYFEMSDADVRRVVEGVLAFFQKNA
ncbi:MAG: DegT/DnrJ/EryC1/StrS aminotransferase family protein [Candidatus Zixiibacteriota bacterium]